MCPKTKLKSNELVKEIGKDWEECEVVAKGRI